MHLCNAGFCFSCAFKARRAAQHGAGQRSACSSAWMREFGPARAMPDAQGIGAQRRRASGANGFADFCHNKSRPPKAEVFDFAKPDDAPHAREWFCRLLPQQSRPPQAGSPAFASVCCQPIRWHCLDLRRKFDLTRPANTSSNIRARARQRGATGERSVQPDSL